MTSTVSQSKPIIKALGPTPDTDIFDMAVNEVFLLMAMDGGPAFDLLVIGWERDNVKYYRSRYRNEISDKVLVTDMFSTEQLKTDLKTWADVANVGNGEENLPRGVNGIKAQQHFAAMRDMVGPGKSGCFKICISK